MPGPWRPSYLHSENNLSAPAMLCYCICLFPALGVGGWVGEVKGSHSRVGCDPVLKAPQQHKRPVWGQWLQVSQHEGTLWRPTSRLNNIKSRDDCYRLLWLFHKASSLLCFLGSLSLPEVTPLSFFFSCPTVIIKKETLLPLQIQVSAAKSNHKASEQAESADESMETTLVIKTKHFLWRAFDFSLHHDFFIVVLKVYIVLLL